MSDQTKRKRRTRTEIVPKETKEQKPVVDEQPQPKLPTEEPVLVVKITKVDEGGYELPTGKVQTRAPNGQIYQVEWSSAAPVLAALTPAIERFPRVPMGLMLGIGLVETAWQHYDARGNVRVRPSDSYDNVPAVGCFQVKIKYHQHRVPEADGYTLEGNAMLATALMDEAIRNKGTWQKGFTSLYFPGNDHATGITQQRYVLALESLIQEFEQAQVGVEPDPIPRETDPYRILMGGNYPSVTYGFLADVGLDFYSYGVGHGTQRSTQHTGDDIAVACGTSLYAPAAGVVDCVGSDGTPRWGQACGAYADSDGGGKGNLTILLDAGIKLTLGHVRDVFVRPGDRVRQGQRVATVGSMRGCHVHVEVSTNVNGTYWLVNPKPALAKAIGSEPQPEPEPEKPVVFGRVPHPPFEDRIVHNSRAWNDIGPRKIVGVCRHSMVGSLKGTDSYFRGEASGKALTDYGIGGSTDGALDGVIYRWNDVGGRRAPWANGPTNGLEGDGVAFVRVYGVNGVNRDLVSIERSDGGNTNTPMSEKQFESMAQLQAYWADQAGIPWHKFPIHPVSGVVTDLEHWEIGTKECPFAPVRSQTTRLQNRIRAILKHWQLGGSPDPVIDPEPELPPPDPIVPKDGYPVGMTEDLARELFGEFTLPDGTKRGFDPSPLGVVSATWLSRGAAEDEFPEADQWIESANDVRYFTFKNGWVLVHSPNLDKQGGWYWLGTEEGELAP